jgi:hypothetical protein
VVKRIPTSVTAAVLILLTAANPPPAPAPAAPDFSYVDLADRAIPAPVAVIATVTEAIPLKPEQSPRIAPGHVRMFIEASATALIRGPQGFSPRLRYLADVPLTAKRKPPKLKKTQVLLLGRPVPGRPGELQLISPDSQFPLGPDVERRVRVILTEAIAPDAPPAVTGIGSAFHVPGAVPGEGETQIFLSTVTGRPISVSVLRRPGQSPAWSVALGEIVDEAAQTPQRDTLLWYRLACGLPRSFPADATAELDAAAAAAAQRDYAFVLDQLGACTRTRPIRRS